MVSPEMRDELKAILEEDFKLEISQDQAVAAALVLIRTFEVLRRNDPKQLNEDEHNDTRSNT